MSRFNLGSSFNQKPLFLLISNNPYRTEVQEVNEWPDDHENDRTDDEPENENNEPVINNDDSEQTHYRNSNSDIIDNNQIQFTKTQLCFIYFIAFSTLIGQTIAAIIAIIFSQKDLFILPGFDFESAKFACNLIIVWSVYVIIPLLFFTFYFCKEKKVFFLMGIFNPLIISCILFPYFSNNTLHQHPSNCIKFERTYMKELLESFNSTDENIVGFKSYYNVTNEYMLYDAVHEYVSNSCGKYAILRLVSICFLFPSYYVSIGLLVFSLLGYEMEFYQLIHETLIIRAMRRREYNNLP